EEDELHAPRADERVDEGPGRVPIDLARVELPVLGRACHDRETDVGIASALVRRVPSQLATAFSADRSHAEETAIAGGAAELGQTAAQVPDRRAAAVGFALELDLVVLRRGQLHAVLEAPDLGSPDREPAGDRLDVRQ